MQLSKLSGAEKAAILLLCLGEEASAKVFEELSDDEVLMISQTMMSIDHVPADIAEDVLASFKKKQQEQSGIFFKGKEFVRKAISASGNSQRAETLLEDVIAGTDSRPLETIATMQPRMVANILAGEHPQTLALIISTQQPGHAGKILAYLPEDLQAEVLLRVAKTDKVSAETIAQLEDVLKRDIGIAVNREQQHVGGLDKVVEILGGVSGGNDQDILARMEEHDTEITEAVRKKMFTFEDLAAAENRILQEILKAVNTETLTMALKTASDELKAKIFGNVSNRAAEMIQEDLEVMGPVRLADVEAEQQVIVKAALKLEEEGKIVLPGRGGADVLV